MINEQLRQFGLAMQLARVLNRTLVLPKLHCSDRIMACACGIPSLGDSLLSIVHVTLMPRPSIADPCYAWYHRGYSMKGLNVFKIPMPELCPLYYWLDLRMATASLGGMLREPTFLSNPRVSKEISQDVATLSLTPGDLPHWNPAKESHLRQVQHRGHTSASSLLRALRKLRSNRVLVVSGLSNFVLDEVSPDSGEGKRPYQSSSPPMLLSDDMVEMVQGNWCADCSITRRGGAVRALNRSVLDQLRQFCRLEARGFLGMPGGQRTCCDGSTSSSHVKWPYDCPLCDAPKHGVTSPVNRSELSISLNHWLPMWADLEQSPASA